MVLPHIIRSEDNCIYSIWYLSHRYCYLPLSWKSWNRFECAVGGVRHPQHTQTGWIYEHIGILLGVHPILHISRIRVNVPPSYIKIGYDNPKKFKLLALKCLFENSFYSLGEYFELQKS